jgi:hypothetical protein
MREFFVGWHQPRSGVSGCGNFDCTMISINRLIDRKSDFPVKRWILDSGAFTRITSGKGHLDPNIYAAQIDRWSKCGELAAAVTQDWMCEKFVLNITGLTIEEHQRLTIERFDLLKSLIKSDTYLMPVLQGYEPHEYVKHLADYGDRIGFGDWVGVGSICKRNANASSIEAVLLAIKTARPDIRLHGFGIKRTALLSPVVWDLLYSADSQAAGLSAGIGSNKYTRSNDPAMAIEYARSIKQPAQISIFRSLASPQPYSDRP